MSGHGHLSPSQIRAKLNHPVIDGDGHWVEYDPVFAEQMRKVGGDKAADGYLAAMACNLERAEDGYQGTPPAANRHARVLDPADRQHARPRDRDDAASPLRAARRDRLGFRDRLSRPPGCACPRINDDATRRAVIRAYNIVSAGYFKDLSDRMTPAAIIPMHTPDEAIAELEFVTKQLGSKVGMFGSAMPRPGGFGRRATTWTPTASPSGTKCSASTASMIMTRSGQKCREVGIAPTFHSDRQQPGAAQFADQLHLQPHRPFRRRRARRRQGHLPRRGDAAFPGTALCLPRRRRRLGRAVVRRSDRALGTAQRQGARKHAVPRSSTARC